MATQPAAADPIRQQWMNWAGTQPNIPKRQRARAADAAIAALTAGATQEQAVMAAVDAARQGYANYYATAAVIVGAITLGLTLFTRGIPLLFAVFTAFAGYQGLKSRTERWQAIVGLILGGVAVVLFVLGLTFWNLTSR